MAPQHPVYSPAVSLAHHHWLTPLRPKNYIHHMNVLYERYFSCMLPVPPPQCLFVNRPSLHAAADTPDPCFACHWLCPCSYCHSHLKRDEWWRCLCVFTELTPSPPPPPPLPPPSTWPGGGSDTRTAALLENKLRRWLRFPGPIDALHGVALLGGSSIDAWPIAIIITLPPSYHLPTE